VKEWTLRSVAHALMKDEINAAIQQETDALPGSAEYLKAYPHAWSKVVENLNDDSRDKLEEKVALWNSGEVPNEIRRRLVSLTIYSDSSNFFSNLTHYMWL
jgi:hypothetical protein